ncbi:MarR family transcriptional regulator [Billgrantia sulfidoxydans]|uniref:MarR family transcriptional regulator n=1 Tax=Billgrantia sulfidoxydans TaxID=2733484 RepID=A0ABX7W8J6_9GAMM|nr:MarR family transcriptional regulator [Halomonas sulfidoxydans]QTP55872.1 MarR family transcriptional regulator [Halomonas sulfidoxydans]
MASKPLSKANTMPGNLLRRCHQISVAIFLRQCEEHNLTQLQYITLAALEELGPVDQITLGSHTALDRNTVAVVVKKLEERGLLSRQRSLADLRSKRVSLTEEGRRLRRAAESAVTIVQEELLYPLSKNERRTLCQLLKKLAKENNHLSRVPIRKPY